MPRACARAVAQRSEQPDRRRPRHPAQMRRRGRVGADARHHRRQRRVLRRVHLRRRRRARRHPSPRSTAGTDGVLAVHSLSKRSNMAGLRSGFVAGDADLVGYLGEVRKHGGLMMPAPVQAATVAALGDDVHVAEQRARYARRRADRAPGARGARAGARRRIVDLLPVAARRRRCPRRLGHRRRSRRPRASSSRPATSTAPPVLDHVRVALTLTDEQVDLVAKRATADL